MAMLCLKEGTVGARALPQDRDPMGPAGLAAITVGAG